MSEAKKKHKSHLFFRSPKRAGKSKLKVEITPVFGQNHLTSSTANNKTRATTKERQI